MQRVFEFKIKEKGIRKWWIANATIEVPEFWETMSEDEQRDYLIKPTGSHAHPQGIYYLASRFQKATGVEDVIDFRFTSTPPNKACSRRVPRRGAKVVKSKSNVTVGRTRG